MALWRALLALFGLGEATRTTDSDTQVGGNGSIHWTTTSKKRT
jgi:hypothetical protein